MDHSPHPRPPLPVSPGQSEGLPWAGPLLVIPQVLRLKKKKTETPHNQLPVREFLDGQLPERWTGRQEPIPCSVWSLRALAH